jgi:predicted amino acid-binding ACT domain protein
MNIRIAKRIPMGITNSIYLVFVKYEVKIKRVSLNIPNQSNTMIYFFNALESSSAQIEIV